MKRLDESFWLVVVVVFAPALLVFSLAAVLGDIVGAYRAEDFFDWLAESGDPWVDVATWAAAGVGWVWLGLLLRTASVAMG